MAEYSYLVKGQKRPLKLVGKPRQGGEGAVWRTSGSSTAAKIYHDPGKADFNKLEVMIRNKPPDPFRVKGHPALAWPRNIIVDKTGNKVGFTMAEIKSAMPLIVVYNPMERLKKARSVDWMYLHTAAHNTAVLVDTIHSYDFVIGDIKESNILINNRALVTIIDTDSFQVKDKATGRVFHCPVGTPEYTPPELIGQDYRKTIRTEYHDRFSLAVIMFLLLFGKDPFNGVVAGNGNNTPVTDLIKSGDWVGGKNSRLKPGRWDIPLNAIHPRLNRLFARCFSEGHRNLRKRPSAAEWAGALKKSISDLRQCKSHKTHWHNRNSGGCTWCSHPVELFSPSPGNPAPNPKPIPKPKPTPKPKPGPVPRPGPGPMPRPMPRPAPKPSPGPIPRHIPVLPHSGLGPLLARINRRLSGRVPPVRFDTRRKIKALGMVSLILVCLWSYLSYLPQLSWLRAHQGSPGIHVGPQLNPAIYERVVGVLYQIRDRITGQFDDRTDNPAYSGAHPSAALSNWQSLDRLRPASSNQVGIRVQGPSFARVGQQLSYRVNHSNPGRLWVIQVEPDDSYSLIFPNRLSENNFFFGNTGVTVPAQGGNWRILASRPVGKHLLAFIWSDFNQDIRHMVGKHRRLSSFTRELSGQYGWTVKKVVVEVK